MPLCSSKQLGSEGNFCIALPLPEDEVKGERIVFGIEIGRECLETDAEQVADVTAIDPTEIACRVTAFIKHADQKTYDSLAHVQKF